LPLKLQWAVINVERLEAHFDGKKRRKKIEETEREKEREKERGWVTLPRKARCAY